MLLIIIYRRTLSVGIFAILSSAAIFTWYTPSLTPGCRQHAAECRKHPSTSNQIPFSLRMCHCLIKHAFHCSSWNSVPRSIHTYLWNTSTHWSACTYHLSRCHTPHQLMAFLLSTYQRRIAEITSKRWAPCCQQLSLPADWILKHEWFFVVLAARKLASGVHM